MLLVHTNFDRSLFLAEALLVDNISELTIADERSTKDRIGICSHILHTTRHVSASSGILIKSTRARVRRGSEAGSGGSVVFFRGRDGRHVPFTPDFRVLLHVYGSDHDGIRRRILVFVLAGWIDGPWCPSGWRCSLNGRHGRVRRR